MLRALGVILVAVLCRVGRGQEDCGDPSVAITRADDSDRVGPDYLTGPWLPMPADYGFQSFTDRPRLAKVVELLGEVYNRSVEIEATATSARESDVPFEERLIQNGTAAISRILADLELIEKQENAHNDFPITQSKITGLVNDVLVPKLEQLSALYQTSADIRFPFAERLAEFSDDLQKVIRAKAEAKSKLMGTVTAQKLREFLAQFDDLGTETKKKIDKEIDAVNILLNTNSKDLADTNSGIKGVEEDISNLRVALSSLLTLASGHIPHQKPVTQITLSNEQQLVTAIRTAAHAEDDMVSGVLEGKDGFVRTLHHIASLMKGLVEANEAAGEPPFEPPSAVQRIK